MDENQVIENDEFEELNVPLPTVTLIMRATESDLQGIRSLGEHYGTPKFADLVRLAVRDAMAHRDCPSLPDEELDLLKRKAEKYDQAIARQNKRKEVKETEGDDEEEEEEEGIEIPEPVISFLKGEKNPGRREFLRYSLAPSNAIVRKPRSKVLYTGKSKAQYQSFIEFINEYGEDGKEAAREFLKGLGIEFRYELEGEA